MCRRASAPGAKREAQRARPPQLDPSVERARSPARAALAPTGKDLEPCYQGTPGECRESGKGAGQPGRSPAGARQAARGHSRRVQRRDRHGHHRHNSGDSRRSQSRERVVKVEALAQRSYDVHQAIFGPSGRTAGTASRTSSRRSSSKSSRKAASRRSAFRLSEGRLHPGKKGERPHPPVAPMVPLSRLSSVSTPQRAASPLTAKGRKESRVGPGRCPCPLSASPRET